MKPLLTITALWALITISYTAQAQRQLIPENLTFKDCSEQPQKIKASFYPANDSLIITYGGLPIFAEKKASDPDLKTRIVNKLKQKIDISSCNNSSDIIRRYQELLEKLPDLIASRINKKIGDKTRSMPLDHESALWELLNNDFTYEFSVVSTDNTNINSGYKVLGSVDGQYKFDADGLKKPLIRNNIDTVLKFIHVNTGIKLPAMYIVKNKKNYVWLDTAGKDTIQITQKTADKFTGKASHLKYNKQAADTTLSVFELSLDADKSKSADKAKTELNSFQAKRISFVLGVGSSVFPYQLYQNPAVDKSLNNNVIIEKGQHIKTNLSFGIVYTPFLYKFIDADHPQGEIVAKGLSLATFINPVNLTKASDAQSFFSATDFGVGIGYKFVGSLMILGTIEFFSVNQPRDWFIEKYKSNDKNFSVPGTGGTTNVQQSFDLNDSNIFRSRIIPTIGFKVCYTFDIIKTYTSLNTDK